MSLARLFDRPVSYVVKVRPAGEAVKVEAVLLYQTDQGGLEGTYAPPNMISHPSVKYVYPSSRWDRLFHGTVEQRIERAKKSVRRWAEKRLRDEERARQVSELARQIAKQYDAGEQP